MKVRKAANVILSSSDPVSSIRRSEANQIAKEGRQRYVKGADEKADVERYETAQ